MLRLAILALVLLLPPAIAQAEAIEGNRIFVEFAYDPSEPELVAVRKHAAKHLAKANAAGRPARISVARYRGNTLISLESVAICDRVKACPLLVFRDLTARPILETTAFQNVLLEYRGNDVYVVIRLWDDLKECRLPPQGMARCKPVAKKKS
ncbi:MAG: hypothetical protein HY055_03510 [Magnetospirillum sp.]|nr:hypothetical protein [Magnetospirillum sp.]